jgi:TolB-like protein
LLYSFEAYALDTERRELQRGLELVALEPQVFDLLVFLIENRDRVVSKDDLFASVWQGRIMSESTLTSRINAARKAVGDSGEQQNLIRTVARKGFRFVGSLRDEPATPPAAAPAEPTRPTIPLPDRPSIAVLPFINMSGDPEQEYFSDGISEDIITALSKLRWFFVIARNSSFIYKGKAVHLKQVAEELGVGYVVEGSVRKGGDRVRITVQLNDVATGSHIWAERYDRDLADVFAVQDEITEAIVAAIEPQVYAAENFRAQRKPPDSMDAWDLVMRALSHYWRVTRQDNVVAQALLEKAIAIDPNYGQALGVLATSHTFSAHMGWEDMATTVPIAERAALAAIRGRQRGPLGTPRAWLRLSVHAALRRLAGRVRVGVAPQSKFLTGPGLLRPGAVLLRALERSQCGRAPCTAAEPARSVLGGLLRHRRLRPVHRAQLRRGDAAGARRSPPT